MTFTAEDEAALHDLLSYLDKNYVKLVGYDGFVAICPDRTTLFFCPELMDGTPDPSDIWPGHLNWGEVTAPEYQEFLDAVNRIFGTSFRFENLAGR